MEEIQETTTEQVLETYSENQIQDEGEELETVAGELPEAEEINEESEA